MHTWCCRKRLWNISSLKVTYQMEVFRQLTYLEYAACSEEYLLALLQRMCPLFLILLVKPTTLLFAWLSHCHAVTVLCQ